MQDVINAINEVISNVDISRKTINKAKKVRTKALKEIDISKQALKQMSSPAVSQGAFEETLSATLESAPLILKEEIRLAAEKNREYNYPPLLVPLLDVANNEELYDITSRGSGWNR